MLSFASTTRVGSLGSRNLPVKAREVRAESRMVRRKLFQQNKLPRDEEGERKSELGPNNLHRRPTAQEYLQ